MKRFYLLAASVLVLAGCQNKENISTGSRQVRISPVFAKATDTNFEENDEIGLSIDNGGESLYADNQRFIYNGNEFVGGLEWYGEDIASVITAYYPYKADGLGSTFSVLTDQTGGLSASDLIAGVKTGVKPSEDAVVVPFKHLLSKIVVEMENVAGKDISKVEIKGLKTTADINLTELLAKASENATTEPITMFTSVKGATYSAIVVPQEAVIEICVTLSDAETLSQKLVSTEFVQGGQYTAKVKVLEGKLAVKISGDIENWTDKGEIGADVPTYTDFAEYDGYFVYKNEKYTTVTLPDGRTWMSQPMRYVPDGYTVSSNPTEESHIWAPYTIESGVATPSESEELIKKNGYFYDYEVLLGKADITADNAASLEGAQGICPNGWHIPTREEMIAFCGYSNKAAGEESITDESATVWDSTAGYGSIKKANELGWNFAWSGTAMKTNYTAARSYNKAAIASANVNDQSLVGLPSVTYIACSTFYQEGTNNLQFFTLMSTYTKTYPDGRLSVAYAHKETGVQVRCIKNK